MPSVILLQDGDRDIQVADAVDSGVMRVDTRACVTRWSAACDKAFLIKGDEKDDFIGG